MSYLFILSAISLCIYQGCSHVAKAVNLAALRKAVQKLTTSLGECTVSCTLFLIFLSLFSIKFSNFLQHQIPNDDQAQCAATLKCICNPEFGI